MPRIIPTLLIHNGGLVKSRQFKDYTYVGDPINAVRIFNEKEVDELFVADIDATVLDRKPDFGLIERIASQCRMPLCYGGGVSSVDDYQRLVSIGVEKVAVASSALANPSLVAQAAKTVGSQSVVAVLDVAKTGFLRSSYVLTSHNSRVRHKVNIIDYIETLQDAGVGEIILNSVQRDGTQDGYDYDLIDLVFERIRVPLTVLGGASSFGEFEKLFSRYGIIGASAGSIFVFKGKYRAVLIQYPSREEKLKLYPQHRVQ